MSGEQAITRPARASWFSVLRTEARILLFRAEEAELVGLGHGHLALGLLCTWLVGMGRYWDHPRASLLQHLGVGSVVYVFVFSAFFYGMLRPLRPERWSYGHLLTFVSLTAPPAVLYAIPVERFFALDMARGINAWFLACVASWRVALLFSYLRLYAKLSGGVRLVSLLLPLALIVAALALLNLDRAVFDVMTGVPEDGGTAGDAAYGVLTLVTVLSVVLSPVLLGLYSGAIVYRRRSLTANPPVPPS